MTAYKGFQYEQLAAGSWRITLPSGLKKVVSATDENAVKAIIDSIAI